MDEMRVLRERFAEIKDYHQSSFNNKVNNGGKNKIWAEITASVNALGHEVREANEIKHKWKNLVSATKPSFSGYKKYERGTGGLRSQENNCPAERRGVIPWLERSFHI